MNNRQKLKFLRNSEINYQKWDHSLVKAPNSRVYATSWFLDRTALTWDALVWGDYEYVMPLTSRKKIGIKYLYQPPFCQQLGIFPSPPPVIARDFYSALIHPFRYSEIQMNAANAPPINATDTQFLPRKNYLLKLSDDYNALCSAYSKNARRNLEKARNNQLNYIDGIRLEEYLNFKQNNQAIKLPKNDLQKLKSIIAYTQYKGIGKITGVYSQYNQLCAAVFFCRWKDRVIYMNAASSPEGKKMRAMFFLIDQFIKTNAGKNLLLDFEGSMISGIARFFKGFGAFPETYFQLKFNRLPLLFRWIKKNQDESIIPFYK